MEAVKIQIEIGLIGRGSTDLQDRKKEKNTEEVNDEFKLVEIVYAELNIKCVHHPDEGINDADYTAYVYQRQKHVYIRKQDGHIRPSTKICFKNIFGKEIMVKCEGGSHMKTLYTKNDDNDMLHIDYDKYTLMTYVCWRRGNFRLT